MVRAAGILHGDMLTCLLHAPMSFFDTTPVGRVMNRFSSDIDVMDNRLPLNFRLWNIYIFSTLATIIVVSINTPYILLVIAGVAVVYLLLLKFFLPTARQITRMESVLRSPIYNHFSETISGVSVIRAYGCVDRFIAECERRVDMNSKFFFASHSASRWMGVRLELLGNLLILAASLFALLGDGLNGAEVGLSITYSLQITLSLNRLLQVISEMEKNIVSAERVKEYTEIEPEAPWSIAGQRPDPSWPCAGSVEFRIYKTRYRPGLDLVLHGIDCNIKPGEKLGIVGRTGAGKSSLALSLFRLIEAAEGAIYIDGQDIATIGLHELRSKLTILPQDPVLFTGSLRQNLDPFGKFDDAAMWKAIECAHLKTAVTQMPEQLGYECGEGGNNLSMGQRQLVCLARTLLHKTRILVLDEATAAVDLETDELIQATIRTEFQECTVLTIAHRLNTILDYDRVMVLGDGLILEIDEPGKLLSDRHSAFYKLAIDAGLAT